MIKNILFISLLLCSSVEAANLHVGMPGLPRGIPNFCELDNNRHNVPVGTTENFTGPLGNFTTICIYGRAIFSTRIPVINIMVFETGILEGSTFEVIGRDVPLLGPTVDPDQFGNGLIAFGAVHITGTVHTVNGVTDRVRSAVFRSENPTGTRFHFMAHGRADIRIKYAKFLDMGRTDAKLPVEDTTYNSDGTFLHYGGNQKGRYSVHMHYNFGLPPGNGNAYQFEFEGDVVENDSKWAYVAHGSSFGLFKSDICYNAIGSCGVEEFGDETGNQWIDNWFDTIHNSSWIIPIGIDYDPEGRACSGFWLRGINNVLKGNHISNACSGIGWWTGCAEEGPCGILVYVNVPKIPGADTSDPTMIETCKGGDGSIVHCQVRNRVGLEVSDNWISNVEMCVEVWASPRVQVLSPPIRNTHCDNVVNGILFRYADVEYVNLQMTGTGIIGGSAILQFNDASPVGLGTGTSIVRDSSFQNFDISYLRIGQLGQATSWSFDNVISGTNRGFLYSNDGQQQIGALDGKGVERPKVYFNRITFPTGKPLMQLTTILPPEAPREFDIKVTNTFPSNYQVYFAEPTPCTDSIAQIIGGWTCPLGSVPVPTPLTITVPSNMIVVSLDGAPVLVNYPNPVVSGGTSPINSSCSPINNSLFPVGVTVVNCTANDSNGNKVSGMFSITVTYTPPVQNPCTILPLRVTVTKWPTGDTGSKSGTWNSGNSVLVERDFLSPPMRFVAKDDRGCTIEITRP